MTSTGGDPHELRALARAGPGQAFLVDRAARTLDVQRRRHERRNRRSRVAVGPAVETARRLGRDLAALDTWVLHVAALVERADADPLRHHLLTLGAGHALLAALPPDGPVDVRSLPLERVSDDDLDAVAAWAGTPVVVRDRLHRERARRWLRALPDRLDRVPPDDLDGLGGWAARWFDQLLVDRVSLVADLHVTRRERQDLLTAQAVGLEQLLARDDLTVLSFDPRSQTPAGGPAIRVALGDVEAATHLAVVLPGTSVGLHAPTSALRDALALHAAAQEVGDASVATVLDLYDAPLDLGRAADRRPGEAAGAATGAFLRDLHLSLPGRPRTTLVGHSYGAFTVARAGAAAPDATDALVLLGAPGAGVPHRDDLGLRPGTPVWAARAPGDPVAGVADLDELVAALPVSLRRRLGPLTLPDAALGPDPVDAEFGAHRLPTSPSPTTPGTAVRGHLSYLAAGTASVAAVAAVVHGRDPRVRPVRPPRRDRRA